MGPFLGRFLSGRSFNNTMNRIFSNAHPPTAEFLESSWNLLLDNEGRKMIPIIIQYLEERRTYIDRWRAPIADPQIPMAMINGIEDPISGFETAQFFQKLQPNSLTVFIENSGHYPHIETPEEVLNAFFKFHKIQPIHD
jgi:pimeloyl-ACP methyl ester carboxylesterase